MHEVFHRIAFLVILEEFGLSIASTDYLSATMDQQALAMGNLKDDWCTEKSSFKLFEGVTLYQCANECMRRSRCLSILYHKEMRLCSLRSEQNITLESTLGLYKSCISSDIMTWDLSIIDVCSSRPCSDLKSRCTVQRYVQHKCTISECLEPPSVPGARISSFLCDVGLTLKYFCDSPNIKVGNSTITCNDEGEWTLSDFRCYPQCDLISPFQHAHLNFESPHVYIKNDSVEYDCVTGYYSKKNTTKLVCDGNGGWSSPQCAKACLEPVIHHGSKADGSSKSPYRPGNIYVVNCAEKYKPVKDVNSESADTLQCQETGEWDLTIVCIPSASGYKYDRDIKMAYKVSGDIKTRDAAISQCLSEGAELLYVRNSVQFQFGKNLAMSQQLQTLMVRNLNAYLINPDFWGAGEPSYVYDIYAYYDKAFGYLWNDYPETHSTNYLCVDRNP